MKLIFIGVIFILLELNVGINILPDFVGYFLILKGCRELSEDSSVLKKLQPVCLAMTAFTGVIYVMNLLKLTSNFGIAGNVIEIAMVAGSLLVIWVLAVGVKELEKKHEQEFNSVAILNSWKGLAVSLAVSYVLVFLVPAIAALVLIVAFLFKVVTLISVYFAQKMYREWKNPVEE